VKDLSGSASATTAAALETCLALVESVEAYPSWYPEVVRSVDVLERDPDGAATKARADLHLSQGPLSRDFEVTMAVEAQRPTTVRLKRIPHHPGDDEQFEVLWTLAEGRISVDLSASLPVPRFLPIGGIGDAVARGFVDAAVRALDA
jgi:hypothetical protein